MNKYLVRFLACLICLTFLLPTSIAHAEPSTSLPAKLIASELHQLPEYFIYLPLIMNGADCTKAPTLLEPANGASLDNLIPLFKWNDGDDPNATSLSMQVAKDIDFAHKVKTLGTGGSVGSGDYRFVSNFEPSTTYYWRANLKCGETQGPYSEVWSFITGSGGTILPAPTPIAPADDTLLTSLSADLSWSAVEGAVEYFAKWALTGTTGGCISETLNTSYTINWCLNPSTTYDWWVTSRNDYAWGESSIKWQFTTPPGTQSLTQEPFPSKIYFDQAGQVITIE